MKRSAVLPKVVAAAVLAFAIGAWFAGCSDGKSGGRKTGTGTGTDTVTGTGTGTDTGTGSTVKGELLIAYETGGGPCPPPGPTVRMNIMEIHDSLDVVLYNNFDDNRKETTISQETLDNLLDLRDAVNFFNLTGPFDFPADVFVSITCYDSGGTEHKVRYLAGGEPAPQALDDFRDALAQLYGTLMNP